MSNNQNQSSKQDSQNQQSQSAQQRSADEGQKRSAPEHPPATPMNQRTNSANFGEGEDSDVVTF